MGMAAYQRVKDQLRNVSPIVSDMLPMEVADVSYDRSKAIQCVCYQHLHMGSWSDVPMMWRDAYQASCVLLGLLLMEAGAFHDAVRELDMGLLMGGVACRSIIHTLIDGAVLGDTMGSRDDTPYVVPEINSNVRGCWENMLSSSARVCEVEFGDVSLERFLVEHLSKHSPVLIRRLARDWPAYRLWNTRGYWRHKIAVGRTIPVEIGRDYMSANWSQKFLYFTDFLDTMENQSEERLYLAQHDLFDQIPRLSEDIVIPDFCLSPHIQKRIWIGPSGTKTPIHQDPYENIFCQIVGYKYIRLYPPEAGPHLELDSSGIAPNTSTIDINFPGNDMLDQLKNLHTECILGPGDAIYIPQGWYHFVQSLTVSFSVSFWWDNQHYNTPAEE